MIDRRRSTSPDIVTANGPKRTIGVYAFETNPQVIVQLRSARSDGLIEHLELPPEDALALGQTICRAAYAKLVPDGPEEGISPRVSFDLYPRKES